MQSKPPRFSRDIGIEKSGQEASALLAGVTGLSRSRVKDAMGKGAVWLQQAGRGKRKRLRRASTILAAGDRLFFHYDASILETRPLEPKLVTDRKQYSVWNKPAGMLCQGTEFGDHCALLRLAEQYFTPRRQTYLIHRLDREARGLVLIAHTAKAAARLSQLFKDRKIEKRYRAVTVGTVGPPGSSRTISRTLDGKEATTRLTVLAVDPEKQTSSIEVSIETGRLHQIRRHLAAIGHPLIGDGRYGTPAPEGLQLEAVSLAFLCPFSGKRVEFII